MGEKLLAELRRVGDRHPSVGDVRGRGLQCEVVKPPFIEAKTR